MPRVTVRRVHRSTGSRLAALSLLGAILGSPSMMMVTASPPPTTPTKSPPSSPRQGTAATTTRAAAVDGDDAAPDAATGDAPGSESVGGTSPGAQDPARRPVRTGRRVPGIIGPVAGEREQGDAAQEDDGTGRLRLTPGRHRPAIEPPGYAVPIEAVVSWTGNAAPAPLLSDVRVFAHVRPHPLLEWQTIELRPLVLAPERFQAAIPCAPCHARPEYWLQAVVDAPPGDDGGALEAWWPPAGPSMPEIYDVGYEQVLAMVPGAVLSFEGRGAERGGGRGGPGQDGVVGGSLPDGSSDWRSPSWPLGEADVTLVAMEWRLDAAPEHDATLVVAIRPGGLGPWTIVEQLKQPRGRWGTLAISVQDHLKHPAEVQVRTWIEGPPSTQARVSAVRLVEIGCTAAFGPDVNDDGVVGLEDLLLVITELGPCTVAGGCPPDVNGDGVIDLSDALAVLAAWAPSAGGGPAPA